MSGNSETRIRIAAILACVFAQPALGQEAPLSGPTGPKVATPPAAPTVRAGEGRGPGANPLPAPAAADPARQSALMALNTATVPRNDPAKMGYSETGLNRMEGVLTLPGGRTVRMGSIGFERDLLRLVQMIGMNELGRTDGVEYAFSTRREDGGIRFYISFALENGELVTPPPVLIPFEGGSQTVSVPGGGNFTLTMDGAHPLTDRERTTADNFNAQRDARAAALAAGIVLPPTPPPLAPPPPPPR